MTSEEIIKYMDASDLSEEYLLWLEEIAGHLLTCDVCQEKLGRAMTAESVCDEEGLAAGLSLMEHEEEIRRSILIAHLLRMQERLGIAELIRRIRDGFVERFLFSMSNLQRNVSAARGEKPQCGQQVTLERQEDKLLLKIPGGTGKGSLTVVLCMEGGEPIVAEAPWDDACGQYVAVVDGCEPEGELEINVIFPDGTGWGKT